MSVLTRRVGETLQIGREINVTVLGVQGNRVRIGMKAPSDVTMHRDEVAHRIATQKASDG